MVATTYAGRRANGDKKRKEILFMDRKEILSAHLVRCCLTVLSEETRAPLPLLEPFWSQGDCECGRLLGRELANPLVKQLRREDRRGSARLARKKVRACAMRAYPRPSSVGLLGNGLLSMPSELSTICSNFLLRTN